MGRVMLCWPRDLESGVDPGQVQMMSSQPSKELWSCSSTKVGAPSGLWVDLGIDHIAIH